LDGAPAPLFPAALEALDVIWLHRPKLRGGRNGGALRGLQQQSTSWPVNITSIPTVGLWNPSKKKACPQEQRRGKNWNGSRTDGMLELQ
jgi:hypothetical protein